MKFSKILSAAAAIAAAGMMTVAASAEILPVEGGDPGLSTGTADYGVQVFNVGNAEENKPATDYGIDLSKIAKFSVTFTVIEEDRIFWDGQVGGGLIISQNGGSGMPSEKEAPELWGKYNWPQQQWWGVNDPDLGLAAATDKDVMAEKVGDYTYKITSNEFPNAIGSGDVADVGCFQIFLKEWSGNISRLEVTELAVLDASGNVLMTFDNKGKGTVGAGASTTTPPADNNGGSDANSGDANANGNNAANNVDTGVEGVAAVVGVAALAAGAVILSRKRK